MQADTCLRQSEHAMWTHMYGNGRRLVVPNPPEVHTTGWMRWDGPQGVNDASATHLGRVLLVSSGGPRERERQRAKCICGWWYALCGCSNDVKLDGKTSYWLYSGNILRQRIIFQRGGLQMCIGIIVHVMLDILLFLRSQSMVRLGKYSTLTSVYSPHVLSLDMNIKLKVFQFKICLYPLIFETLKRLKYILKKNKWAVFLFYWLKIKY